MLATIFLAVIALGSLLQAALMLGILLGGWKLVHKMDALEERLFEQIRTAAENLAALSEMALRPARRIDAAVTKATRKIDSGASLFPRAAGRAAEPLVTVAALWKGLRRGLEAYRQLEPPAPPREAPPRERAAGAPAHVEPPAAKISRPPEASPRRQAEI